MSLRFRKSIKLIPGVKLNLSKSGVSASIGKPGFTTNISARGVKNTVSIPGTGISWSSSSSNRPTNHSSRDSSLSSSKSDNLYANFNSYELISLKKIISEHIRDNSSSLNYAYNLYADYTSDEFIPLKKIIAKSLELTVDDRKKMSKIAEKYHRERAKSEGIIGTLSKKYKEKHNQIAAGLKTSYEQLEGKVKELSVEIGSLYENFPLIENVIAAAEKLRTSRGAWDRTEYKETAGVIENRLINLSEFQKPPCLEVLGPSGPLFSASGNTLYLYPEFVYFGNGSHLDNYIKLDDIDVFFFTENEPVGNDLSVFNDLTEAPPVWIHRNTDGSMDARYADNKKVPAAKYAYLCIVGKDDRSDFRVRIRLSNVRFAKEFSLAFRKLIDDYAISRMVF